MAQLKQHQPKTDSSLEQVQTSALQQLQQYAQISEITAWSDVLALYRQLKQEQLKQQQPNQVLLILDDVNQCYYTSMHAGQRDELYFDEELHFKDLDKDQYSVAEQQVELYQLQYRIEQLQAPELQTSITALSKVLDYGAEDGAVLLAINANPVPMLDEQVEVKVFAAPSPALKLAAMPNGYFSVDLNPFQSYALIQHLEQCYGLEFVGLGASLLYFVKTTVLSAVQIEQLIACLSQMYQFDQATQQGLQQHLLQQDYLILSYGESLMDFADDYALNNE
ncbi:hypothetical protein EC844_12256 [Acinetobacter calcoaceticus]|uniref:Uncharacterized protein n=1 Tax=Acinetobacter calcoaceticus TaxID=471 RepID=A0A4R1XH14_ACICA|nr:hypothetical protein EC844_12256 [Acinetobacter calcoaceticus]